MIVRMSKVRILGPAARMSEVVGVLQNIGILHLSAPRTTSPLPPATLTPTQQRHRRNLRRALADLDAIETAFPLTGPPPVGTEPSTTTDLAAWARLAGRVRRATDRIAGQVAALEDERALLLKYRQLLGALESLLPTLGSLEHGRVYHLVLRSGQEAGARILRQELTSFLGDAFELREQRLPGGELAVLLLVPASAAERTERLLSAGRVQEVPLPSPYRGQPVAEAIQGMAARLAAIPDQMARLRLAREQLARTHGAELSRARAAMHDHVARLDALPVLRPEPTRLRAGRLGARCAAEPAGGRAGRAGGEHCGRGRDRPRGVARRGHPGRAVQPQALPPFRAYRPPGSPSPVREPGSHAVCGGLLPHVLRPDAGRHRLRPRAGGLGLVLHARSRPGSAARAAAEIAGPCAIFAIIFGAAYGEFFGDLGRRWLGLRPLFDREEAIVPFLGLAVALGTVHILLGLGLGVVNAVRGHHRRAALGRGLTAGMIVLIVAALLASFEVLPRALFTPSVIALLVAFPLLILAEGIVAPIELLSAIGHILSYARIMALGIASVMLAVVANRMAGAVGSAVVGAVFALLFHMVNFALGLFSPTIHALRLHYVEFFGKFYSPGGAEYHPLTRWTALPKPTP